MNILINLGYIYKQLSEYGQGIPQSQTADKRGRVTQH